MIILLLIAVAIVAVLIFATTKPDTFRYERSLNIQASPDKIFALINDFHRWGEWSPYEKLDPAMRRSYTGADNGVGAGYGWESAGKAGVGSMRITESTPPSKIVIDLNFTKPFQANNIAEFTLVTQADSTNVNWAMHGPATFVSKLMSVFFSLDKMVGKDFETGLANLKAVTEK